MFLFTNSLDTCVILDVNDYRLIELILTIHLIVDVNDINYISY